MAATAARPLVIVVASWFLATARVLSTSSAPDTVGSPATAADGAAFRPWPLLMQPVYTLFYTLVLSSLFSMAWAEHDSRFGSGDYDTKFGFIKDDAAAYGFVLRSAVACAAGVALGVVWGIYMRRIAQPPGDHKQRRLSVFWYCCGQLVVSLIALASFAAADGLFGKQNGPKK